MSDSDIRCETMILDLLHTSPRITLDDLVARLPELSWSRLFQSVDALSRRGEIRLDLRTFQYELSLPCPVGAASVVAPEVRAGRTFV